MKVLIADDHPLTVEGYVYALSQSAYFSEPGIEFSKAFTCEEAVNIIDRTREKGGEFDLVILDYSFSGTQAAKYKNGGELHLYIKGVFPRSRSMLITARTESLLVYEIIQRYRPEGLILKNDLTPDYLVSSLYRIYNGDKVVSQTAEELYRAVLKKELMLDEHNRAIVIYLSKGYKLTEIVNEMPLSLPALKKRVSKLREAFEVADIQELVKTVFEKGFV